MLFNSLHFAIFLPTVFFLYWFVFNRNLKKQNFFLLIASYVFYGWWDWRFLSLIIFSSFVDYFVGLTLAKRDNERVRKFLLFLSLSVNLGLLGIFKYFNFFVDNFVVAFLKFGINMEISRIRIILPVGISFYTFQTMSYTLDVFRKKIKPINDIVAFFAFVGFFPQLVAGPIERASNLLPQFRERRNFDYAKAVDGMRQILWGFFKKVVIADNCAYYANQIFGNYSEHSGGTLVIGALFFTFQIYGDFSGYSDIAIGVAKLFGFDLIRNFAFPYFSRDIAEFWRRWHISLSSWFRDYLYIPLGGSRKHQIRNIFVIFLVSGFWHGANWTFIFWGLLNAVYFLPLMLFQKNRQNLDIVAKGKLMPNIKEVIQMLFTFCLTVLAWIFFRSTTLTDAFKYIQGIFSSSILTVSHYSGIRNSLEIIVVVIVFVIIEWFGRDEQYGIAKLGCNWSRSFRWIIYYSILLSIFWFRTEGQEFIYFQF